MRKIILNLAISLDNMIVDENYGYDWIKGDENKSNDTEKQYDFNKFLVNCDVIVMGKKSYDDIPSETLESFGDKHIYVATHSKEKPNRANVSFINEDIVGEILTLKQKEGKDIWLFGGAGLCDAFIKANVIDEYVFGIIPTIVGKGKRLFKDNNPMIELKMKECTVNEGISILVYENRN